MIQALETVHLSKRYGRKWALYDCTLQIPLGCIAGLVGPNGAGKTTLLHLATGLLAPSRGTISVLGQTPGKDAQHLLPRLGFVSQDHPIYKNFTVKEMLTLGQKLKSSLESRTGLEAPGPPAYPTLSTNREAFRRATGTGCPRSRACQAAGVLTS